MVRVRAVAPCSGSGERTGSYADVDSLLVILDIRFGPLPPELRTVVEDLAERLDWDTLMRLARQVPNLEEFLDAG
jgi:hypothetical protein